MAIHLAYYNKRGEVKTIQMNLDALRSKVLCVPNEDYFVKGIVFTNRYLSAYDVHKIIGEYLTADELHFLTCDYGFFPELRKELYRNENQEFKLKITEELAIALK